MTLPMLVVPSKLQIQHKARPDLQTTGNKECAYWHIACTSVLSVPNVMLVSVCTSTRVYRCMYVNMCNCMRIYVKWTEHIDVLQCARAWHVITHTEAGMCSYVFWSRRLVHVSNTHVSKGKKLSLSLDKYIHTCIHTYIHTYTCVCVCSHRFLGGIVWVWNSRVNWHWDSWP